MRLREIKNDEWEKVAAYVDTLLLPIHSLSFIDKQWADEEMKRCEWVAHALEKRLAGRLLLLPAIPYTGDDPSLFASYLRSLVQNWQKSGFHYLLLLSDRMHWPEEEEQEGSLIVHQAVLPERDTDSLEEWEVIVEKVYEEVLQLWVKNA